MTKVGDIYVGQTDFGNRIYVYIVISVGATSGIRLLYDSENNPALNRDIVGYPNNTVPTESERKIILTLLERIIYDIPEALS